jgi:hypothetical protein
VEFALKHPEVAAEFRNFLRQQQLEGMPPTSTASSQPAAMH